MLFFLIYLLLFQNAFFKWIPRLIPETPDVYLQQQISEPGLILYDVISYNLNLTLDIRNEYIIAHNTIVYETIENMSDIRLNMAGMNVDSVVEHGSILNFFRTEDILTIEFSMSKNQGIRDSIRIYYRGTPVSGLYFRTNEYGDTIVYTHNEPYDARFWFPCKDDPSDKALLNFQIKYRQNNISVSNGKLANSRQEEPGWICDHWQENSPIATYLIAFSVGPFQKIEEYYVRDKISMPVRYYVYPEDREKGRFALEATVPMLEFYSSYIGLYPFFNEKYAMVEVPIREANAMENQTCTMMRDRIMDNLEIIAHELVHHWWGNAVTPERFNDIWLNEGFASYFDALYTEFTKGEKRFLERMAEYRSGIFRDGSVVYPVGNPPENLLFSAAVYLKGAWILHMLRFEVGEDNFREIIQTYFDRFMYKNATSADFQTVCEEITGRDLDVFFDQWLYRGGIPQLYLTWNQPTDLLSFTIEQTQEGPVYDFTLDVKITGIESDTVISVNNDSRLFDYQINFSEPVVSIELDPFRRVLNQNNTPVYFVPQKPQLRLIYPNPFNEEVTITFELEQVQVIEISVWNVLGQKIERLFKGKEGAGVHNIIWSAKNMTSGVYFCLLESESSADVEKLVLIK